MIKNRILAPNKLGKKIIIIYLCLSIGYTSVFWLKKPSLLIEVIITVVLNKAT